MTTPDASRGPESIRALSELADLPYFEVDADRNVVAVSPAMERLTGFAAEDVLGRSCLRLHRCEECLKGCGVFDKGVVRDKRLELYRADGSIIAVKKSGQIFVGDDGRITGAIEYVSPLESDTDAASPARDEADAIRDALHRSQYRRSEAARSLGMSRTTLWRKMKQYGL